ncbi:hypothetical protein LIER_14616 [Lithospermum erythrorhizon]|uniref:Protein kinase domain-containing protein n=1 Tax=Lithospermum erythrorhizon TaxID=34254 RepID=A0AAV3PZS5_LITER
MVIGLLGFHMKQCKFLATCSVLFVIKSYPLVVSLSFGFTSFSRDDVNITYERAYPSNNVIQLTTTFASMGRATYSEPLHLWDRSSGNLTDFSFVIDSRNRSAYGDGVAFFLAPVGSRIPEYATKGGSLGLTTDDQMLNSTDNLFVAVEFDAFKNPWDPVGDHVGIDINSMRSVTNNSWFTNIREGKENDAWISYNSLTHNLSVAFTGYRFNTTIQQNIHYIVDLRDYLPEFVTFGFSASTGNVSALHSISSWNFSSTTLEKTDQNITSGSNEIPLQSTRKNKIGLVVGLIVGGLIFVVVLVVSLLFIRMKKKDKRRESEFDAVFNISNEFESGRGPKKFSHSVISKATNKFSEHEKLGEGGFGGVYKGYLKDLNLHVAVKRVSSGSSQGLKEYASEVRIISRLRHRNLVQLIGWCHEKNDLLLVYEFMPNGSLDTHLFKAENGLLAWDVRYKIAQGLASALLYLHEEWEQCVVHRDIKSSNIMLDINFSAKLGDFGLARFVDHDKTSQTTVLAGTMGYMAPESVITGKANKETDVYSFGIVALEIACGRKPIDIKAEETQVNLVEYVWSLYGDGKLLEAADHKLASNFNEQEMECLLVVGLWCAHPDSEARPSIKQASRVLHFETSLPNLPKTLPKPTYDSTPSNFSRTITSKSNKFHSSSSSYNSNASSGASTSTSSLLKSL